MRRLVAVTLVVLGLMFVPTDAHAQGFWRWLEHLSGPDINGPGFDIVFACRGSDLRRTDRTDATPFVSPYCVDASRNRNWLSIGVEVYALAGDNNQTSEPDDRVDLVGVMPFVDFNTRFGIAVGAGFGVRHYEAGAGSFNKPVIEGTIKLRPVRLLSGNRPERASLRHDLIELRVGLVYQDAFEAGQFGPGTPELDGDVSPVVIFAFNLVR